MSVLCAGCARLISLNTMVSTSIHVVAKDEILFSFLMANHYAIVYRQ